MSGVREYSFREGDRSEYLAHFLLSSLGLCTPIPRQEDIGFDFSCSIADQERGLLTFGYPYLISIKSLSSPAIAVTPSKTCVEQNGDSHVAWLFRQEQPIFLGIVDKKEISLRIYSMLPLWFLYYEGGPTIGSIEIKPRLSNSAMSDVGKPKRLHELSEWKDHYHFEVDLGHPVTIISLDTIRDETKTKRAKRLLRVAVDFGQRNLLHFRLNIPHFHWFAKTKPDASAIQPGFHYAPVPKHPSAIRDVMQSLAPALVSLAMHFITTGNAKSLEACAVLLNHAPPSVLPPEVVEALPELKVRMDLYASKSENN